MSITEYYGKVLGVTHTSTNCGICTITEKTLTRTRVRVWRKR